MEKYSVQGHQANKYQSKNWKPVLFQSPNSFCCALAASQNAMKRLHRAGAHTGGLISQDAAGQGGAGTGQAGPAERLCVKSLLGTHLKPGRT